MEQNFVYSLFGDGIFFYLTVILIPLLFILIYALIAILGELKIASWVQDRLGPMRTGWKGVLQPLAEVIKLLQKEDIVPDAANRPLFNLAPFVMFTGAFAALAALPFAANFVPAHLNIGLFYVFAISAFGIIGIVMGGWASNNKYSLLGAMRGVSQMVSYEIPIALAILSIAALAGSLDLQDIINQQGGGFWNWNIFGGYGSFLKILVIPFTLTLFIIHFVGGLAETNRVPFDIPEGESEIVAGYHTEYSGMKFAMFFFAEYANMFTISAVIAICFLGGWQSPFGDFLNQPFMQPVWFILKSLLLVFVQIWLRWTLPRFRVDQLMFLTWKVMTPTAFVCFIAIVIWSMLR